MILLASLLLACPPVEVDGDGDGALAEVDCDDTDPTVYPGATDVCDDLDQDCDQAVDEDASFTTWFLDEDGDGYGGQTVQACGPGSGRVEIGGDCEDTDAERNPDTIWRVDADGDGYGDPSTVVQQCSQPAGHVLDASDCDDADASRNPETVWSFDADGDGWGGETTMTQCEPPEGYVAEGGDCADEDPLVNPGAIERCDGLDEDCDGVVDNLEDTGGTSADCPATSCAVMAENRPDLPDGVYWLEGDQAGPIEVWCDLQGGWTFFKVETSNKKLAVGAEAECAQHGLQLLVPRSHAHLEAAYDIAVSTQYGPADATFLTILGVYPPFSGADCRFTAMTSEDPDCEWAASDGGSFWIHEATDFDEPNGDSPVGGSAIYTWETDGSLSEIAEDVQGGASRRFLCQVGDE